MKQILIGRRWRCVKKTHEKKKERKDDEKIPTPSIAELSVMWSPSSSSCDVNWTTSWTPYLVMNESSFSSHIHILCPSHTLRAGQSYNRWFMKNMCGGERGLHLILKIKEIRIFFFFEMKVNLLRHLFIWCLVRIWFFSLLSLKKLNSLRLKI